MEIGSVPATSCGQGKTHVRRRRIIGGTVSSEGEWPWHISLRMSGTHVCGGSILSESLIVTAAHCVGMIISFFG